jgi:diguanylate cyclase (GGDEF)-like protein
VIERFINRVPGWLWIAFGAAVALAAVAASVAAATALRVRKKAREIAAVSAVALIDPLTGVFNRRGFIEAAERELGRARRYGHELAIACVDVRGLKNVNDSHGHVAGDRLIGAAAALLGDSARRDDVVARIGGDELAVLLIEQSADTAGSVVARIEGQVPAARAELGLAAPWDLTIGVASYPDDGDTVEALLSCADRRLYEQRGIAIV